MRSTCRAGHGLPNSLLETGGLQMILSKIVRVDQYDGLAPFVSGPE
jgi:hypothetical protein